jgi:hypothetical protein
MISEPGEASGGGSSCRPRGEKRVVPGKPERKPTILAGSKGAKSVYIFLPLADITAGDVAEALNLIVLGVYVKVGMVPPAAVDDAYEQMSESAKRNIKAIEAPKVAVPTHAANKLQLPPGM